MSWKPPESDFIPPEADFGTAKDQNNFVESKPEKPILVESKDKFKYPIQLNPELLAPVLRGVFPTLAQAGAGLGVGVALAPFTGGVSIPLAAGGGVLAGQLSDLTVELVNQNFGTHYSTTKDAVTHLLDKIGVPKPESSGEKIIEAVSEGAAQMGGAAKGLSALSKAIQPETILPLEKRFSAEATRQFTKLMGERPIEQSVAGAVGAGAMEASKQAGQGPLAQLAWGLGTASAVPFAAGAGRALSGFLPKTATQKYAQAEELASQAYKGMTSDKKQAIDALERSKEVSDDQVRMMTGDITGDPGILAMQDVLQRESNVLANRKLENIAGLSRKVGEGLQPVGASPEETQQYFKSVIDNIVEQTEKNKQAAIAQGDAESAKLIEEAGAKASAIRAKADQGVVNAEDAFQQIKGEYENLFKDLSSLKESTAKDTLSNNVFQSIDRQKNREKVYINQLYAAAEREVPKFYQKNTAESKAGLVKEFGEERRLPNEVQKILSEVQDAKGNLKLRLLSQLRADIRAINSEIRAAQSSAARQAEVPALIKFKEALNKDIESLEGVSENLKKANRAYYEYAQRYKEGASGDVFHPKALTSKTIDQYIGKSESSASPEEIQRMRDAIIGKQDIPNLSPEEYANAEADRSTAIQGVSDWVLAKMASEVKGAKTSQSIENWLQTKGNRILEIFPESKKRIIQIQDQFTNLENQVSEAQKAIKEFKIQKIKEGENAVAIEKQANLLSDQVKQKYKDEVARLDREISSATNPQSNPAARFIGGNPYEVVNKIMSNKVDAEKQVQNLLAQAAQDPSGKATEGLKNAFRGWIGSQARTTSKESVGKGIAAEKAIAEDFQVDLKKMNDLMKKGSSTRNALEMVFGPDSQELESLDKVRQQLDMMSRSSQLSAKGMTEAEDKRGEVADTLMGIVGLAAGLKGYLTWKSTDLARKIQKQYKKETLDLFKNILVDSMTDQELARKLLMKVNEENFPAIQRLFANYGIKNLKASDFGLQTTEPKKENSENSFEEE